MIAEFVRDKESFLAFRYLDFRRFIFSKFLFTLGMQIQFVVLSWQIYQITHDPLSLGFLGLAEAIPAVGLSLYGGYFADRHDRRKIMLILQVLIFLSSCILLYLTYRMSSVVGASQSAIPFYVIMFFIGMTRAFYSPAQFSLMTQVVPREAYANSSAWNSTFWHVAVVLGSSAGGLMLGFLGKHTTYTVVIILLLFSGFQLFRIASIPLKKQAAADSMRKNIREGLRFVFSNQAILGALSLDLVAVLFGGATAMLPIFASDILQVGEKGFGFLRAAPFAGSVLMALYMTKHPPLKRAGKKLLICVAGFSMCMIAFAISRNFYLSLFILALSGAFDNVSVVIRSTIVQLKTPDEMRGRVSSVSTMFISSSNEIGAFESGFAAKLLGLVPSVVLGGTVALTSVFAASRWLPELRKLDLDKS